MPTVDPWLPERLRREAAVRKGEQRVKAAALDVLRVVLDLTRAAFNTDTGHLDNAVLDDRDPRWTKALDEVLLPAIGSVFAQTFNEEVTRRGGTLAAAAEAVLSAEPYVAEHLASVTNRLVRVPNEVFDVVRRELEVGRGLGESIPNLAARVDNVLSSTGMERWKNRATTIARTETIGAYNSGTQNGTRALAEHYGYDPSDIVQQWVATLDTKTRESHAEADGYMTREGVFDIGGDLLEYPGDPAGSPEEVVNCVVGSTLVEWPGQVIHASTRATYTGDLFELVTAVGHRLTVTPNHPVLTPRGYVAAKALREGDCVLATREPVAPDVHDTPPSAEQVHAALREVGSKAWVGARRVDFHGDRPDDEVEVVRPHRDLSLVHRTHAVSGVRELALSRLSDRHPSFAGLSTAVGAAHRHGAHCGGWWLGPASSDVGSDGVGPALRRGERGHANAVCFAPAADRQPEFGEAADHEWPTDAEVLRHLHHAHALGMEPCEVVEVNVLAGTHQVFNLHTEQGWFMGNGIAQHNCRCTLLELLPGDPDYPDLDDPFSMVDVPPPPKVPDRDAVNWNSQASMNRYFDAQRRWNEWQEKFPAQAFGYRSRVLGDIDLRALGVTLDDAARTPLAAAEAANPLWAIDPANPNCANCVMAWEGRMRGYDVVALGRRDAGMTPMAQTFRWYDPRVGGPPNLMSVWVPRSITPRLAARDYITDHYKVGAHGSISVVWKPEGGFQFGHVFGWIRDNSTHGVSFYDPQPGVQALWGSRVWSRIDPDMPIQLLRFDNLPLPTGEGITRRS